MKVYDNSIETVSTIENPSTVKIVLSYIPYPTSSLGVVNVDENADLTYSRKFIELVKMNTSWEQYRQIVDTKFTELSINPILPKLIATETPQSVQGTGNIFKTSTTTGSVATGSVETTSVAAVNKIVYSESDALGNPIRVDVTYTINSDSTLTIKDVVDNTTEYNKTFTNSELKDFWKQYVYGNTSTISNLKFENPGVQVITNNGKDPIALNALRSILKVNYPMN